MSLYIVMNEESVKLACVQSAFISAVYVQVIYCQYTDTNIPTVFKEAKRDP